MSPEGWRDGSLADLADYINGRAFKPSDWSSSGLPIVRIAQITDPRAVPNRYDGSDVEDRHLIRNGDLLFSWSATLAAIRWRRGDAILNQHIFKVIEKPGVDRDFLQHLLTRSIPNLADESHGSTMKHIRKGVLDVFRVAVPPLGEQRKIAAILSSVDDAIEATQAVIDQLQVVKKAVMTDLLTRGLPGRHTRFKQTEIGEVPEEWEIVRLDSLAVVQTGIAKGKQIEHGVELPYLRVANVQDGFVDLAEIKTIVVEPSSVDRFRLRPGDVLFTEGGDADKLGRGCVWRGQIDPCLHQNHVFSVRPNKERLRPEFLALWAASPRGKAYFLDCAKQTTNLASINSTQLKALPVPLPRIDVQDEVISAVSSTTDRIDVERTYQAQLSAAKSALMSVLLTGELRVSPDEAAA